MNIQTKWLIVILLLLFFAIIAVLFLQGKHPTQSPSTPSTPSPTPSIDNYCVDKNSLNCSQEVELSYECTQNYQDWALINCPGWKETELISPISASELSMGWYYGTLDQKKPNTPTTWLFEEAGRSSCWHDSATKCGYLPD